MDLDKLRASLIKHEGSVLYCYDDATGKPIVAGSKVIGNPTIGTGRLLTLAKGITDAERDVLLTNDMAWAVAEAQAQDWWRMVADNDARARAMTEILFNIGVTKLKTFVSTLKALRGGDFENAARGFMFSKWAEQVGKEKGQRAFVLSEMIRTGKD